MKILTKYTLRYCWFFICFQTLAQQNTLSEQTYHAINNYIEYSNEVVHALQIMHDEFEYLNRNFNMVVEQQQDTLAYKAEPVFNNYDYFPVLIDTLYQEIFDEIVHIKAEQRSKPLQFVGKINEVVYKIDTLRQNLEKYIRSGAYKNDKHLAQGYEWLRRIEVAYFDIYALQEKLHWSLAAIVNSYSNPAQNPRYGRVFGQLDAMLQQSKRLLRAVRAKDKSAALAADCNKLREQLNDLKNNKGTYLSGIPVEETLIYNRYDQVLKMGESMLGHVLNYLGSLDARYAGRVHPPYYYYYNDDLLGTYNRYGNGMAYLYNRIIVYTKERVLWADEMPPIFEVHYPNHPEFENFRRDSMPDPEWFIAQIEKNKQDSIARADSIRNAKKIIPQVGEPSLDGFAANNLILLIDISASMGSPEKLPLLKKAMEDFVKLLREEDNITIITYSDEAEMLLPPTSAKNKEKILATLNGLKVRTSSNIDKGLKLAYIVAKESFVENGNNRIIISTDGNFKLQKGTQKLIQKQSKKQIKLTVFYFSEKEYSHIRLNLNQLGVWGKGRYHYITADTAEAALLMEAQSVRKSNSEQ